MEDIQLSSETTSEKDETIERKSVDEKSVINSSQLISIPKQKDIIVIAIMIIVNVANAMLVLLKVGFEKNQNFVKTNYFYGVTAYISASFSIGTSAIESFGDVFVSILLLVQLYLDKKVSKSNYPRGRSSEATTNLTASVVMIALACFNFIQSFDSLITSNLNPEFSFIHIFVVVVNIVIKLLLFFICLLKKDISQINVLMRDQWTDVKTNSIAVISVTIAHYYWKETDFIGATIIFLIIIWNWVPIAKTSWFKLQGIKGEEESNEAVRKVLIRNRLKYKSLAGFSTYHLGHKYIIEIYCDFESPDDKKMLEMELLRLSDVHACYFFPEIESKDMKNLLSIEETISHDKVKDESRLLLKV